MFAPANAEVLAVRLPGRESRIREPQISTMRDAVADIATDAADLSDLPLAILGQCSGAILAFELAAALALTRGAVGVSGQVAPDVVAARRSNPAPTDAELVEEIGDGIPAIIRKNPEFLELFLPVIRSDMQMLQDYEPTPRLLSIPIVGFHGRHDLSVSESDIDGWQRQTSASFSLVPLDAAHLMTSDNAGPVFEALGTHIGA